MRKGEKITELEKEELGHLSKGLEGKSLPILEEEQVRKKWVGESTWVT